MYIELGELYFVDENIDLPELFHIHTYEDIKDEWTTGIELSTFKFPTRIFPVRTLTEIFIRDRENAFENIRFSKYNSYPSRFNCLFAFEWRHRNSWLDRLKNKSSKYQLVRLKLIEGKIINMEDCFFDRPSQKNDNELAETYWKGEEICVSGNLPVFLFEGEFTITEILLKNT